MLRQLTNLRRFGRIRTSSPTRRKSKPTILRDHPDWEFDTVLDFVLASLGKADDDFFFVQIGAFDGKQGDPMNHLIHAHRWRGILVEPQVDSFRALEKEYESVETLQLFNVAIGPTDGELTIYTRKSGGVSIASTEKHLLIKPGAGRTTVVGHTVPCWTLATLLQKSAVASPIDLLQIDTEGFDFEIIRSIDFQAIRPTVIRYEHTLLKQSDRNDCLSLLAAEGYRFILEDKDTIAVHPSLGCAQAIRAAA